MQSIDESTTNGAYVVALAEQLLAEQETERSGAANSLAADLDTAVQRFAQRHGGPNGRHAPADPGSAEAAFYRDLIPLSTPQSGQQYAFEVDLDSCSGCKACVTACHNLNGLEEDELWRSVGLLHGGEEDRPALQHVTTTCHHCLDPACLEGCPVNAYEKDLTTGIVVHLDDQCIGCQYCILKCPYDVPQYSAAKGIVRKCDMCQQRLAVGEPPACVQACPNGAIRIRLVDTGTIADACELEQFLPTAPSPSYTLPTTIYRSSRPLPRNLTPADDLTARPQHGHLALVVMLVLTQMSVGAFIVDYWWFGRGSGLDPNLAAAIHPAHLFTALASGLLGLGASVLHLGRPRYAYRALLGLRHSWLSREILCFGLFAASAAAYVAVGWLGPTLSISVAGVQSMLGALSAGLGVAAVGCSVMIYADTPRPFWSGPRTGLKFVLTAAILGCCVSLVVCVLSAAISPRATIQDALGSLGVPLCQGIVVALGAKLLFETAIFGHLRRAGGRRRRRRDPLTRSAGLLAGPLSMIVVKRYFCGLLGLLLSVTLIEQATIAPQGGFHPLFIVILAVLMFALLTTGELMERYLFFAASIPPKMPGGTMS